MLASNLSLGLRVYRSSAKLSHKDAQNAIDGKALGDVTADPQHETSAIAHDIKILHELAQQMRARRFQAGALETSSVGLKFKLDDDGMPVDCRREERTDAHIMVEEVGVVYY